MTETEPLDSLKLFTGEQTLDLEPTTPETPEFLKTVQDAAPEIEVLAEEEFPTLPIEEASPDKRKAIGEEAKKRIDKLTRDKRELQRQIEEQQAAEVKLRRERDEFYHQKQLADYSAAGAFKQQLTFELAQLKQELLKANESMDFAKQVEIQQKMIDASVRLNSTTQYLQTRKPQEKPTYEIPAQPQAQAQTVPKTVERKVNKWMQDNTWFDSRLVQEVNGGSRALRSDEEEERYTMSVAAEGIATSLLRQGYDVTNEDDDEFGTEAFFNEVNARIRKRFPHKFQTATRATIPVAPKSNPAPQSSANKSVVRYKADEAAMLQGLAQYGGVSIQDIAKQTAKRVATEGNN